MGWIDWKLRLRALVFRERVENELDEELRFHLDMQARKHRQEGEDSPGAGRHARLRFGAVERMKEECRDVRGVRWAEMLGQDVRYALRGFRHTPVFALTVIATIALGLGLNTALFTAFDAYVLRPLAVNDPYSLYQFTWNTRAGQEHQFTAREFEEFRNDNPAFSAVVGLDGLFTRAGGHMLLGNLATGNYFSFLGVNAALGRTLLPADSAIPESSPVMVLSYTAWKEKFGADPAIVGRKVVIRGHPLEVVGVARPGFTGLSEIPLDFWAPITMAPLLKVSGSFLPPQPAGRIVIVGRLKPDMSLRRAEAALAAWSQRHTAGLPEAEKSTGVVLRSEATTVPLEPEVLAAFAPVLLAFVLVLVIACANVANMMLARAMSRQREIGVRLALGATRVRLIVQLLTESVLLALPAAAVGFGISELAIELCPRLMLATIPAGYSEFIRFVPLHPDLRVFLFMLAAALASALLFGLVPALQATRSNVMQASRGEFLTDVRPGRLRNILVVAQVALSALLLICTAIGLRANNQVRRLDLGFETRGVVEIELQDTLRPRVLRAIRSLPLVASVAAASKVPLMGTLPTVPVGAAHRPERMPGRFMYVSPEFFPVLGIPVLRGRNFSAAEAAAALPLAVVSESAARLFWPGRDPVGQSFQIDRVPQAPGAARYGAAPPAYTSALVIGVARDVVSGYIGDAGDRSCLYFPQPVDMAGGTLLVRVEGNAEAARRKLDAALSESVPGAVDQIHSMDEIHAAQVYPYRALAWVSSAIGSLALLLTLSGLYGVLSFLVTQRTKEIGIRVALGASAGRAAGIVLRQSLKLAGLGTGLGAVAALGASRLLASQLESPMFDSVDFVAFALGVLVVLAASACAAYVPSRRAARIEPLTTLRHD